MRSPSTTSPPRNSFSFAMIHARSVASAAFQSAQETELKSLRRSIGCFSAVDLRPDANGVNASAARPRVFALPPGWGSGGVLNHGQAPFGSKLRDSNAATQLNSSPVCLGLPVPTLCSGLVPPAQSGRPPGSLVMFAPGAALVSPQQLPVVPG